MRDLLKFILVKTFFTGFRKFVSLGAIAYALINLGSAPNMDDELSDFSEFTDEDISEFTEKPVKRFPASVDSLNTVTSDRTRANVRDKDENFFNDDNKSYRESGFQETTNNFVNELEQNSNVVDRVRPDRNRGISRLPGSSDGSSFDQLEGSDNSASSQGSLNDCNGTDSICGGGGGNFIAGGSPGINLNDPTDEDEPTRASPSPQTQRNIQCSADQPQGLFGTSVAVNLSCSETANIVWCVQLGPGMTCDPYSSSNNYTGTIDLNTGDGVYNLSFYGRTNNGAISPVYDLIYTIDSTLPALIVNFPLIQVQSTELPFVNRTQSTDFGKANHYYHQINLKTHDPTAAGLNWNCEEILTQHQTLVTPAALPIQTEYATEGLVSSDQIDQTIDAAKLSTGDNFIVTLFEDRTRNIISCQVQKIILEDTFNAAFTGTGSTPVFSGVRKTAGAFVGYGHYQNVPNSMTSGPNENQQGQTVNKSDLFHIVY